MKRFNSQLRYVEARPRKDKKGAKATTSVVVAGAASSEGGVSKSYVDSNLVTLSTEQTIPGAKNFTGGIKVNGQPLIYNAELGVWELTGDLLVTGNVAWFASIKGFKPSTIMDAVQVDGETIVKNELGQLKVIGGGSGGSGGGLTVSDLSNYLTTNKYTKQSDVETLISTALTPYALTAAIPTNNNQLSNGAGYITAAALDGYATQSWVEGKKYLTGITSSQVTTALGYTPYNSSNPDKYIKGIDYDMVIAALGYTPYSTTNPMGYLTISSLLGYATEQWVGDNYLASSNFSKANIKSTLGISDWALSATKPSYTAAEVGALAISGGSVSSDDYQPLFVNSNFSSGIEDVRIAIAHNWNVKGLFNWESNGVGLRMYNTACGSAIGIKDDGTPYYDSYELIHSGNIGSYNAGSATKLATPRTIWGQSFDGTADVSGTIKSVDVIRNANSNWLVGEDDIDGNIYIGSNAFAKARILDNNNGQLALTAVGGVLAKLPLLRSDPSLGALDSAGVFQLTHDYGFGMYSWVRNTGDGYIQVGTDSRYVGAYAYNLYLNPLGGNVAIGGTTASAMFHVHGNAQIDGDVLVNGNFSWITQSQRSLKHITSEQGLSLAQLELIKPIKFYWKDGRDAVLHVGGVADVFDVVLPEVVARNKGVLCLNYVDAAFYVGASLIAPVLDHERRITEGEREREVLKKENATLKRELAIMKQMLNQLPA